MTHLRLLFGFFIFGLLAIPAQAQTAEELAKFDPGELYYQAWRNFKDGEDFEKQKDFIKAFNSYQKALTFYDVVRISHPRHKPDLVLDRCALSSQAMERVHDKARDQQDQLTEKEDSPLVEVAPTSKPGPSIPAKPFARTVNAEQEKTIRSLQKEQNRLRQQLADQANQRSADAARIRKELQASQRRLAQEAAKPFRNQVRDLNAKIEQIRGERDAMKRARNEARRAEERAKRKLAATEQELKDARAEIAEKEAIIAEQTRINGKVAAGQMERIKTLKELVAVKDQMIAEANQKTGEMGTRLRQSEEMFSELQQERDSLLEQRDKLSGLLDLKKSDQIQALITQNVELSRELKQAKENLAFLENDSDAAKDEVLRARALMLSAKSRIETLQSQNDEANRRLGLMKTDLENAKKDLAAQLNGEELNERGKEEVMMLQKIIARQQAKIKADEGAAQLLLEQAERMAQNDAELKEVMSYVRGMKKMELTDREEDLLDSIGSDIVLNNRIRPSASEFRQATSNLRNFKKDQTSVAARLFAKGDFEASRGIFELIIDEDPGAWQAMINAGLVEMKLNNPVRAAEHFRQSIMVSGDRKSPFAHYLLGEVSYKLGLIEQAENEIKTSLNLEPKNPKGHVILGNIAFQNQNVKSAVFHYEEAISQDPAVPEPYINLAIIDIQSGKLTEARKHYQEFLKNGGVADPTLEKRLGI